MQWIYNDGGRDQAGFKGKAGDCVARSIAIASGIPYAQVYKVLANGAGKERKTRGKSARNGIHTTRRWFKDYMQSIGFSWVACMQIGTGCTVHLTDGELPNGRLVVAVSKHYTAVINGVVHDTFNPQRESTVFSKFPGWETIELKTGERRNINGVFHTSRRCVYGYWIMREETLGRR